LPSSNDPRITDWLVNLLYSESTSWSTWKRAAEVLTQQREPRALEPILRALANNTFAAEAMKAAAEYGDVRAVEPIIAILTNPATDRSRRRAAAEALGKLKDKRAVEPLITALDEPDWWVYSTVSTALAHLNDRRAVEPLRRLLMQTSEDKLPDSSTAEALVKLGWHPRLVEEKIALYAALRNWKELARLGEPAVPVFIRAIRQFHRDEHLYAAFASLGTPAITPLLNLLRDDRENWWFRTTVAAILSKMGAAQAIPVLVGILKEPEADLSRMAAHALDDAGWQPANQDEQIAYWLAKRDWQQVKKAGSAATELLLKYVAQQDMERFQIAVEMLIHMQDKRVVEPLIAALRNWHHVIRYTAIRALKELRDGRAVAPLTALLNDPYNTPRMKIFSALKKIGTPEAMAVIEKRANRRHRRKLKLPPKRKSEKP
jgi:HEAT repeat protein